MCDETCPKSSAANPVCGQCHTGEARSIDVTPNCRCYCCLCSRPYCCCCHSSSCSAKPPTKQVTLLTEALGMRDKRPLALVSSVSNESERKQLGSCSFSEEGAKRVASQNASTLDGTRKYTSTVITTVSTCLTEAQKRASDLLTTTLSTAVGYFARPLSTVWMLPQHAPLNLDHLIARQLSEILLLGQRYDVAIEDQRRAFWDDYTSQLLLTYRKGFTPINAESSDAEKRCCLESDVKELAPENRDVVGDFATRHYAAECSGTTQRDSQVSPSASELPFLRRALCEDETGHLISDLGWGCMIRVTQMALCRCLITLRLGRHWRRPSLSARSTVEDNREIFASTSLASVTTEASGLQKALPVNDSSLRRFLTILGYCSDTPDAPLSIHNVALSASTIFGRAAGHWLGPTTCAQTVAHLMSSFSDRFPDVIPIVFPDGLSIHSTVRGLWQTTPQAPVAAQSGISNDESPSVAESKTSTQQSPRHNQSVAALMILCVRLGSEYFNADKYAAPLSRCFELPQFQGIAGGGSTTSAYFFIGKCEDGLLFLDPHVAVLTQTSFLSSLFEHFNMQPPLLVPLKNEEAPTTPRSHFSASSIDNTRLLFDTLQSSLFPMAYDACILNSKCLGSGRPSVLPWTSLNPSMALYFLCQGLHDYEELTEKLSEIARDAKTPELFETMEFPVVFPLHATTHEEDTCIIMDP